MLLMHIFILSFYVAFTSQQKLNKFRKVYAKIESTIYDRYHTNIQHGPTEICVCCGGLCFPVQTKKIKINDIELKFSKEFTVKVFFVKRFMIEAVSIMCKTCYKYVVNGNVPNLC